MDEVFQDWINIGDLTFVRRSSIVGVAVVGKEVRITIAGSDDRWVPSSSAEEALAFGAWLLRKTDEPMLTPAKE